MKITTRKVLQSAWIAGGVLLAANIISEIVCDIKLERNERSNIERFHDARIASIDNARDVMSEEIKAGRYDGSGINVIMKDFQDLIKLNDPNTF